MPETALSYARALRVVGQILESFHAPSYDVVVHDDRYLIRCLGLDHKKNALSSILQMWKRQNSAFAPDGKNNSELIYTRADIERLDEQGRERRRDFHASPEPFSLSSILRATGDFLDRKGNCRLLMVSRRDHQVVVLFETPQGMRKVEDYQLPSFYQFWVSMYVKRKSTSGPHI